MIGRGKGLHIDADLGDYGLGDVVVDAGNILQPLGVVAKGSERGLEPRVELRDRGFDLIDRLEMLTDQKAMMAAQASFQRGGEFLARAGELGMAEFGQPPRVALARHDRLQDAPAAKAQNVGNDRGQLDVGLLQRRLNPLGVTDDLARQLAPRAGQVARVLDRLRRHETGADQPVGEKVGDPGRIVGVALAARHVANVRGVGENQAEVVAQHVPDRLPIDAGRLHRHMRDLGLGQPRRQRQKALRRGREPRQLRSNLSAGHNPPAGHDLLLMHVQSRTSSMQRLHRAPSQDKAAGATNQKTGTLSYGLRARRPKPPRRGDNPKYAWAIRSNSSSGSKHQGVSDLFAGRRHNRPFHPSRCAQTNENSSRPPGSQSLPYSHILAGPHLVRSGRVPAPSCAGESHMSRGLLR